MLDQPAGAVARIVGGIDEEGEGCKERAGTLVLLSCDIGDIDMAEPGRGHQLGQTAALVTMMGKEVAAIAPEPGQLRDDVVEVGCVDDGDLF